MQILRILCRSRKAAVKVIDKAGYPAVRLADGVDIIQPHLLDQPILQRLVRTLNAPLSLAAVGADKFNAQIAQRPAKLRGTTAASVRSVNAENGVLVAVKCDGFTMNISTRALPSYNRTQTLSHRSAGA